MKKTMMILLAVVLVVAISVGGTLAYLTAQTDKVVNTFTAGSLTSVDFTLQEHKAIPESDGSYELDEELVQSNEYKVVPGVEIPKDPFITVNPDIDAYLFTEVVGSTGEGWSWAIAAGWTKMVGVSGPHGGQMYWRAVTHSTEPQVIGILKDDKITVEGSFDTAKAASMNLDFYAYLCQQASFDNAAAAWSAVKDDFKLTP